MKLEVFVLILLWNCVSGNPVTEEENEVVELKDNAENVCIDQEVQNQIINITFIQSQDVKDYTWCLQVPPRCVTYRTKLVTRFREENVTRVVNVRSCCPGYSPDGKGYCKAVCQESCGAHGHCAEPDVCRCDPGFSGDKCQDVGCPGGNWGPDCSNPCPCQNGGRCEPHTGKCLCVPGWKGLHCQNQCSQDSFGQDCAQTCQCSVGQRCHHVSGECLPCSPGTYGFQCAKECQCSTNGTTLCLHTTGQCFCASNWYGNTCELHCPFGYVDEVCHTQPIDPQVCMCSSDQMTCDHLKGCVCKEDGDCGGGQRYLDLQRAAPLDQGNDSNSHSKTVAVVLSVLFLTIATIICIVVYYRRRMNRLKSDLQNRSVYYVENSILDPGRHQNHDMVITDQDPLENYQDPIVQTVFQANNLLNNINTSGGATSNAKMEKNVNIDRFKLGLQDEEQPSNSCLKSVEASGACALVDEDVEAPRSPYEAAALEKKNLDINVFEEESPSKEKNNFLLDNSRKINKPNVDLVFHRNNLVLSDQKKDETEENDDEVAIAKMTAYLNQQH